MKAPLFLISLVLTASVAASAHAAVYKCTGANGKIEYGDSPCENAQAVDVGGNTIKGNRADDPAASAVKIGMPKNQVRNLWGSPKETSLTSDSEQWTYNRDGRTVLVFFDENGRVGQITNSSDSSPGASPAEESRNAAPPPKSKEDEEAKEREDKAGNRRFISKNMSEGIVRSKIGEPEKIDWWNNLECWYYAPTSKDYQTRTRICFDGNGSVTTIDRMVER